MKDDRSGTILFYWQDAWLPHSSFLLEGLECHPAISDLVVAGPARRAQAAKIFTAAGKAPRSMTRAVEERTRSYGWRETACRFGEWRRLIRKYDPEVVIVADEALSLNVLLAAVANGLYGHGVVLFYGFENLVQGAGWNLFWRRPTLGGLRRCLLRQLRRLLLDRLLMPVRRRLVRGGLVSYEECAEVVRRQGWNPPMRQQWWPVDTNVFVPDGLEAEFGLATPFIVGFVGRFVAEKGVGLLLDAMAQLDERFGLVMVGDGPEASAYERRIDELGLRNRVRMMPPQTASALAECYRAMDLLVLPSIPTSTWKEQYGRVLVEARCCGVRVAGSDSGAIPGVVGDPDMLFPVGDSQALARVIRHAAAARSGCGQISRYVSTAEFVTAWLALAREAL